MLSKFLILTLLMAIFFVSMVEDNVLIFVLTLIIWFIIMVVMLAILVFLGVA